MMGIVLWPFLLPIAAASGWWFGRGHQETDLRSHTARLSREYYVGLNYLLNEQPDKAVDIFIKLLEVDGDTVETHLALGSLFRRRGEVDRAIRVHQNLIARPQLSREQRAESLLALGRDYMSAGVLDRAERIFREIVTLGDEQAIAGLHFLLDIYQQEKSWDQAIKIAQTLKSVTGKPMHVTIAHHHCELAEAALKEMNVEAAQRQLKQALNIDSNCARATLLLARIEVNQGNYAVAITLYQQVKEQDPRYLMEAIKPMTFCFEALNDIDVMCTYLNGLLEEYPRVTIVITLADAFQKHHGTERAIHFLQKQLLQHPSLPGLCKLTEWQYDQSAADNKDKLLLQHNIAKQLIEDTPIYRCDNCGFSGKTLHWQCPGCKQWSRISPIRL